jgi:hypothetical protein
VWLWTTINAANQPYDYDSFRVFIWNLRRHRYETALIQRHLRGYFPTIVNASTGRFGVCVEKEDGQRSRREYRLVENLVKFAGEGACTGDSSAQSTNDSNSPQNHGRSESELDKLKGKLKGIIK